MLIPLNHHEGPKVPKRFAIIILGFAILVAACGGDEDGSQVASLENETTTTLADGAVSAAENTEQAVLELTACLRDNGLDIEDPGVDATATSTLATSAISPTSIRRSPNKPSMSAGSTSRA